MEFNIFWWFCMSIMVGHALSNDTDLFYSSEKDEGVCTKLSSYDKTVMEPYLVTYRETYKTRCRLIFTCQRERINSYTSHRRVKKTFTRTIKSCCHGYEQDEKSSCKAICLHPCINGYCEKPGVCSCSPGFRQTDDPTRCEPVCSTPCTNGNCAAPENCVCNFGYIQDDGQVCQPVCTRNCSYGVCTAPETCICLPGYRDTLAIGCQPYCSSGCEHGTCVQPEMCHCNEGYEFSTESCQPICDACSKGICVAPGVCQCIPGYSKDENGYCQAQCDRCFNGTCISPKKCVCNEGFVANDNGKCIPDCNNGCPNGDCISPNVCHCREGYRNVSGQCQPHCDICINGKCIAPGKCNCMSGYAFAENSSTICVPACSPKCGNLEDCMHPNQCTCKIGYERFKGKCEPKCSSCLNGTCIAPQECSCFSSFEHPPLVADRCVSICQLHCEDDTRTCLERDECACIKGYSNESGTCIPVCRKKCSDNAKCVAPEQCACYDGYESRNNSRACTPLCLGGCVNGTCIEPDVCVCDKGFYMSESNKCVKCNPCGLNARCVSRGKCECDPGYKKSKENSDCVADCDQGCSRQQNCKLGCVNGTCTALGNCTCDSGYIQRMLTDNKTYCIANDFQHDHASFQDNKPTEASEQKTKNDNISFGKALSLYAGVGLFVLILVAVGVAALVERNRLQHVVSWFRERRNLVNNENSNATYEVSHISDTASTSILLESQNKFET